MALRALALWAAGLANLGRAKAATPPLDCKIRGLAFEYANHVQELDAAHATDVWDALELSAACGRQPPHWQQPPPRRDGPQQAATETATMFVVDPVFGDDDRAAAVAATLDRHDVQQPSCPPFRTILAATRAVRQHRRMRPSAPAGRTIELAKGTHYLNATISLTPQDSGTVYTATLSPGGKTVARVSGGHKVQGGWTMAPEIGPGVQWASVPPHLPATAAIFVNGNRFHRARFPNGDPEHDLMPTNSLPPASRFLPAPKYGDGCSPPRVNSRPGDGSYTCGLIEILTPDKANVSSQGGMRKTYSAFTGGSANRFSPPIIHGPPRAYGSYAEGSPGPQAPGGIVLDSALAARFSKWHAPSTGVVTAFSKQFWGTWIWQVAGLNSSDLVFGRGGFQNNQGSAALSQWYVSNIIEELDSPGEFFLDPEEGKLYLKANHSLSATTDTVVVPVLDTLFEVRGSKDDPVRGVEFRNLLFEHATSTFLHDMFVPSGGDWAMHRGGAVFVEGAERTVVDSCYFRKLDGTNLFLSGYNRNTTVVDSEFYSTGESAIASAGDTDLIDGSAMTVPRGTLVERSFFHEIGIWGKQTSFYFQAISCEATLRNNSKC